jgi:hypothetical protein
MEANVVKVAIFVIMKLAESEDGCAGFVAEGCCGLLVDELKISEDGQLRANLFCTINLLARSEEFVAEFVEIVVAWPALLKALNISQADSSE